MGDDMASQFRNSNLGYYLYTTIVILIGGASIFVFWFMVTGFNIGRFSENTNVGPVYVGGMTESEAELEVRSLIETWVQNDNVVFELNYQDFTYQFNRNLFDFNESESIQNIQDGRTVPLEVWYPDTIREQVLLEIQSLPFLSGLEFQFDFEALLDDVLTDASLMRTFSSKQLIDYVINEDNLFVLLFETTQPREAGNMGPLAIPPYIDGIVLYNKLVEAYPEGFTINAKSTISMVETFDPLIFTDQELSFLGVLFLDMIPHLNLNVFERDYRAVINATYYTDHTFPYYGRNVRVRYSQDIDFSFENNTFDHYRVSFDLVGNFLNLRIHGAPRINPIVVEYRTLSTPYNIEVVDPSIPVRDGFNGRVVQVFRHILDQEDNIISSTRVVFESYRPRNAFIHE